jgi:acyl-CoA synthetase (AMP-forming)/AMP-acid ligase II
MVVGLPDERFGERVVALVVARSGSVPSDLDDHVRRHVAGYKAPRQMFAVEAVERFPSGKPDYAWARDRARELASRASTSAQSSA